VHLIGFVFVEAIQKKEAERVEEMTSGGNDEDSGNPQSESTAVLSTADAPAADSNEDSSSEATVQNSVS